MTEARAPLVFLRQPRPADPDNPEDSANHPDRLLYHWTWGDLEFLYAQWRLTRIPTERESCTLWAELTPEQRQALQEGLVQLCAFPVQALHDLFQQTAAAGPAARPADPPPGVKTAP